MQKWEYSIEWYPHGENISKKWSDFIEKTTNLGKEGWELVAITTRPIKVFHPDGDTIEARASKGMVDGTLESWVFKRLIGK